MFGRSVFPKGISAILYGDTGSLSLTSKPAETLLAVTAYAGALRKLAPVLQADTSHLSPRSKTGTYLCIIIDQSQNSHVPCEKLLPAIALYCADTARQIHCRTAIWTLGGRLLFHPARLLDSRRTTLKDPFSCGYSPFPLCLHPETSSVWHELPKMSEA